MVEIIHILMLILICVFLYHFIKGCNCDGFSVGVQKYQGSTCEDSEICRASETDSGYTYDCVGGKCLQLERKCGPSKEDCKNTPFGTCDNIGRLCKNECEEPMGVGVENGVDIV